MNLRTNLLIAAVRKQSANVARMAVVVASGFAFIAMANAASIPVNNFSFEQPDLGLLFTDSTPASSNPIPNWTPLTDTSAGVRNSSALFADQGSQWAYLSAGNYFVQQPNSGTATFANNTTYTLTVAVADNYATSAANYIVAIIDPLDNKLNAGGTGSIEPFDMGNPDAPQNWVDVTVSFTTGASDPLAGQALRIRLEEAAGGGQLFYDNVRLDAVTVPEPTSFGIFCMGAIGLLRVARRRA